MFIHDTYSLLAEAAAMDLSANTEGVLTESEIDTRMKNIDEVSEDIIYTAEMVTVIAVDESYLTDINALMPFMKTNGLKSVGEALDMVAEANGMPPKSIGLLVESDAYVDALLEKACAKKTKEGKNKILDKIKKATDLSDKLKKKGYTVKKKKSLDEECCKESEDSEKQYERMSKKMAIEKDKGDGVYSDGYNARVSTIKHNRFAERKSNGKYTAGHKTSFDHASDAIERHNRRHPDDKIIKGHRMQKEASDIFNFDTI